MTTIDRSTNADAAADASVKAKHRAMWASGDYPALAHDLIADLGPALVDACGVRPGMRVLDVAAGAGNAALVAADAGADVVAGDLTPELFAAGRAAAAERGVEVTWREADAEALPFADAAFDVVMSCVGVMFAPHHQQAADELVRVCRPGGTIGLLNWTPDGFIGQMFVLMKPYAPPPPPGAQPPPLWGDERHVAALLGDRVERMQTRRQSVAIPFATGAEFRDYFKQHYGPTIAVYRHLGADAERAAELDRALAELGEQNLVATGTATMNWEYQLATAVKLLCARSSGRRLTFHPRDYIKNARTAVHVFVLARSNTSATPDWHRGRQQLRRRGPACRARRAGELDLRGHNRRALLRPRRQFVPQPARLAGAGRVRPGSSPGSSTSSC